MAGLKVNFSTEEAGSEARDFEALPTGKYPVFVSDITMEECGPNSKNPGKPYWHLELTIQEGHPHAGRKFWTNVMLFDGALYSLAQIAKALGGKLETEIMKGNVPETTELDGKEFVVRVQKQRDKYREEKQEADGERTANDPPLFKNEVKSFFSAGTSVASSASSGSTSVLP
jgi:hypothetical protein